jgi:NAD(P)-dependent dehydrogenase (short-subunit alcohol dehydrogenase family)
MPRGSERWRPNCPAASGCPPTRPTRPPCARRSPRRGRRWRAIALKPLKRATEADFLDAFRLNALGAALAVQAAQEALAAARGSVVLFSSIAARAGFPNHAAIAAAKGAVEGLTVALAAELAPVRVNCIAPSLTRSAMAAPLIGNAQMAEAIAKQHPIPRLGEGGDSAALADFLLSDAAGWITGQVMAVDGGRSRVRTRG